MFALAFTLAASIVGAHPLEGRVWEIANGRFVEPQQVLARAAEARFVLLGEKHDNPEHHRLHLLVLRHLAASSTPALALEQLDRENQAALDAARAEPTANAERVADAGRFDRTSWKWDGYKPLLELALERGLPIVAANLSRAAAREIVRVPARSGLAPAPPALRGDIERDIADSHCERPPEPLLSGMVEAQRARDATMAAVLTDHVGRGAVLVTGAGHARKDRGVPAYLGEKAAVLTIAFTEVIEGSLDPVTYVDPRSYDYLWFTRPAQRTDPCAR